MCTVHKCNLLPARSFELILGLLVQQCGRDGLVTQQFQDVFFNKSQYKIKLGTLSWHLYFVAENEDK